MLLTLQYVGAFYMTNTLMFVYKMARSSLYLYLADEFAVLILLCVGKLVNLYFVFLNLLHYLEKRKKSEG